MGAAKKLICLLRSCFLLMKIGIFSVVKIRVFFCRCGGFY